MTIEEAIDILKNDIEICTPNQEEAVDMAIKSIQTVERIKIACMTINEFDGFGDEICDAISEYLYDTGQEWERGGS